MPRLLPIAVCLLALSGCGASAQAPRQQAGRDASTGQGQGVVGIGQADLDAALAAQRAVLEQAGRDAEQRQEQALAKFAAEVRSAPSAQASRDAVSTSVVSTHDLASTITWGLVVTVSIVSVVCVGGVVSAVIIGVVAWGMIGLRRSIDAGNAATIRVLATLPNEFATLLNGKLITAFRAAVWGERETDSRASPPGGRPLSPPAAQPPAGPGSGGAA